MRAGQRGRIGRGVKRRELSFSEEYVRASEVVGCSEYHNTDDEGREYVFNPDEWDYDEHADGWDGEGWADGWDD